MIYPFEPLVLDESDEATAAFLRTLNAQDDDRSSARTYADYDESESRLRRRMLQHGNMTGMAYSWLWFLIFFMSICLIGSTLEGNLYGMALGIAVLALLVLDVFGLSRQFLNRECWLLVPGGLLVRSGGLRLGKVDLRRYARGQAVLVVMRTKRTLWLAAVSDGRSLHSTSVTRDEAHLLLRCWLSPLEPLPLDRYGDLLASDA